MNLHAIKSYFNNMLLWLIVCTQIAFFPVSVNAQESTATNQVQSNNQTTETTETTETQPATTSQQQPAPTSQATTPTQPAPKAPAKPKAPENPDPYVFNKSTGMWENSKYAWDPNTGKTTPKTQLDYSYNPSTGRWDTTDHAYDPAAGRYVPNNHAAMQQQTTSQAPSQTSGNGVTQASISDTGPNSNNTIDSNNDSLEASISDTGPNSNNTIDSNNTSSATFDNFFDASISNTIDSSSASGNASVLQNTNGGSAITGDATAIANIINMLQSSWGLGASDLAVFNANIDGNVFGDLTVDPGQLNPGVSASNYAGYDNLVVNSQVDGQINNDVSLTANSGNATVARNTQAGNATTGNATAIANIINMMNSAISAGQSFVGSININGNLDGDILLPSWMKNQLLAAGSAANSSANSNANVDNTGPNSNNSINIEDDSSLVGKFEDNIAINNNINSVSTSGNAQITKNTQAGTATTGNSDSKVNIINLTGRQVVGDNSLLVFVNVLGEWVGVIMDAPAGVTSGVLGNGITQNNQLARNTEVNSQNNMEINNNIDVTAVSGDAEVSSNTQAGNATTGNATTAVNIANIANNQFSLTGWFGVLFINVFGSWNGSFGVNTAAGNAPIIRGGQGGGSSSNNGSVAGVANNNTANQSVAVPSTRVFGFIPAPQSGVTPENEPAINNESTIDQKQLNESSNTTALNDEPQVEEIVASLAGSPDWLAPLGTAIIMGALIVLIDRRWGFITGSN